MGYNKKDKNKIEIKMPELSKQVSLYAGISVNQARFAIRAVAASIVYFLSQDAQVYVPRLGKFHVVHVEYKGTPVLPADFVSSQICFRPGGTVKKCVKKKIVL